MARRRQKLDPYTTDERDPLELMAMLVVGGSYRLPVEGRSTSTSRMTASDVAAAVGYMKDPLARRTALAVVSRAGRAELARLSMLAYREVVHAVRKVRPMPIDLRLPADRWRLRLAVFDAATELVWPERRRSMRELAKEAKMRQGTYAALHKCATSTLQQALNEARREFAVRMWGSGERRHDDLPDEASTMVEPG